jgi:hypothetical protein
MDDPTRRCENDTGIETRLPGLPVPSGSPVKFPGDNMNPNVSRIFVSLVLCFAILHLPFALQAKDSGYTVIYDGGSLANLKSGEKLKMYIGPSGIRLMDERAKRSLPPALLLRLRRLAMVRMFTAA